MDFMNEFVFIFTRISPKSVLKDSFDKKLSLVQWMDRRLIRDKPLFQPMMAWLTDEYMRHSAFVS